MSVPASTETNSTGRTGYRDSAEFLFSAFIMALLAALFAVLYATFIFSGPLLEFVRPSYQVFLIGGAVMMAVTCVFSQFRGVFALLQDEAVVILSVVAVAMLQSTPGATAAGIYPSILAVIAVSTIITGALFFALGFFRLGKIIRYVPFSVTAGFMITIGWLLLHDGLGIGLGINVTPASLSRLIEPRLLALMLVTVGFAFAINFVCRLVREVFALPLVLVCGLIGFHSLVFFSGYSYVELSAIGWLLPVSNAGADSINSLWAGFGAIDWSLVAGQWRAYISIAMVSALALLLAVTGLELSTQQQVDVDRELRACGIANIASGGVGGAAGYHDISVTTMMYQADAANTKAVFLAAGLCLAAVLLIGGDWLSYVPVPFLGGFFMWLGWQLWQEWLFGHGNYLQKQDWIAVVAIVVVTVYFGFIFGVLLGVGVGISLFLIDYSQVKTVQYVVNGRETRSNVDRSKDSEQVLYDEGARITLVKLQGYLFFARSHQLVERLLPTLRDNETGSKAFVVIDFRGVSGIDSTAVMGFLQLYQVAQRSSGELVFSGLDEKLQADLAKSSLSHSFIRYFGDQNQALAYCEEQLLKEKNADSLPENAIELFMLQSGLDGERQQLEQYLTRVDVPQGQNLIEVGQGADFLYIVEAGTFHVTTQSADGRALLLRVLEPGSVFGEMALYMEGGKRTATVTAATDAVVRKLELNRMQEMEREHPELALRIHKYLARLLATKLRQTNTLLERFS